MELQTTLKKIGMEEDLFYVHETYPYQSEAAE